MHHHDMHQICKNYIHRYVLVQTTDNQSFDGIIESVDNDNVYLAVPIGQVEHEERNDERVFGGFGYGGYGYPGFGYGPYPAYGFPGYGYPYYPYPRRRFQRLVLPLAALTALTLLPYF